MRLIDATVNEMLDETVSVEIQIWELAIISAILGKSSYAEGRENVQESITIKDEYIDELSERVNGNNIYEDIVDILVDKLVSERRID